MKVNKFVISLICGLVFLAAFIYIVYRPDSLQSEITLHLPVSSGKEEKTESVNGAADQGTMNNSDFKEASSSEAQDDLSHYKVAQELKKLHQNDVLGVDRENSDYANYSDSALNELAIAGDVIAVKLLALRYREQSKNESDYEKSMALREKANVLHEKAVIYGDKEFLGFMPTLRDAQLRISDPRLTPEQKHQAALDMLANMEFMGLRGALRQKYTNQAMAFEIYKEFGFPEKLSEDDKSIVRQRAAEIYKTYERKRVESGFGPFDNSVPESMKEHYENDRREYELKMGDNAL